MFVCQSQFGSPFFWPPNLLLEFCIVRVDFFVLGNETLRPSDRGCLMCHARPPFLVPYPLPDPWTAPHDENPGTGALDYAEGMGIEGDFQTCRGEGIIRGCLVWLGVGFGVWK